MRRGISNNWLYPAVFAALVLPAAGVLAQDMPDPEDYGPVFEELAFEAADTDGDGWVSEAEFVRDAAAAFSGLDANRDGKLTPRELGPHDAGQFSKADTNRDGVLLFDEVMRSKMDAFRAADKDGDNALTFNELVERVRNEVYQ